MTFPRIFLFALWRIRWLAFLWRRGRVKQRQVALAPLRGAGKMRPLQLLDHFLAEKKVLFLIENILAQLLDLLGKDFILPTES